MCSCTHREERRVASREEPQRVSVQSAELADPGGGPADQPGILEIEQTFVAPVTEIVRLRQHSYVWPVERTLAFQNLLHNVNGEPVVALEKPSVFAVDMSQVWVVPGVELGHQ